MTPVLTPKLSKLLEVLSLTAEQKADARARGAIV